MSGVSWTGGRLDFDSVWQIKIVYGPPRPKESRPGIAFLEEDDGSEQTATMATTTTTSTTNTATTKTETVMTKKSTGLPSLPVQEVGDDKGSPLLFLNIEKKKKKKNKKRRRRR